MLPDFTKFPRISKTIYLGSEYIPLYFSPAKHVPGFSIRDIDPTDPERKGLSELALDNETYPEYVVHYMHAYIEENGTRKPLPVDWSYDEEYYDFILKIGNDTLHYDLSDIEERLDKVAEDTATYVWYRSPLLRSGTHVFIPARNIYDIEDDIREEVEDTTYDESRNIIKDMLEEAGFHCTVKDNTYHCERTKPDRKEVIIF